MPIIDNTAILNITDGTTTIDLLRVREGIAVENWRQAVAQYRGGGTFQESSLADGRRLVDKKFATIRETMPLKIGSTGTTGTQNTSIEVLHQMFAMFEKASNYWTTGWQCEPVWLEKRASCETNTEYAIVVTATLPDIDDIYIERFDTGALVDMALVIERGQWGATQPGVGTATPISAVETWNSVNLGNVDDSGVREPATSGVYWANMRSPANVTHIYTWSAANGFSANLQNGGVPYDLIDSVGVAPQVNDYVMFGIDVTVDPDAPLRSLVFDIGTAQTGLTIVWEYSVGAAFIAPDALQDNTATAQAFDTTGINSAHWGFFFVAAPVAPTSWIINGVDAWWVRARITAVPGPVVIPTQQNRDVYAITWPYTEIQADEIDGDLPALMRTLITLQSQNPDEPEALSPIRDYYFNRWVMGLRSLSRGSNFTSILNTDNRANANPSGITIAAGANTVFAADTDAPAGVSATTTTVGVSAMADRVTFTLDTTISPEYYGTYSVFVRFKPISFAFGFNTEVSFRFGAGGQTLTNTQGTLEFPGILELSIAEYGTIDIPAKGVVTTADSMTVDISVRIEALGALTIDIIDVILIPVDEWAIDTQDVVKDADSAIERGSLLDIDSIVNSKTPLRSLARNATTSELLGIYLAVKNGPAILQRDARQRLWAVAMRSQGSGWVTAPEVAATIAIEKQQRYLAPRGSR